MTGGGLLQSAVQWAYTNFALGIVMFAVLFAGLLTMAGRIGLILLVGICAGAVIIGNYSTIAGVLLGGAGFTVTGP